MMPLFCASAVEDWVLDSPVATRAASGWHRERARVYYRLFCRKTDQIFVLLQQHLALTTHEGFLAP